VELLDEIEERESVRVPVQLSVLGKMKEDLQKYLNFEFLLRHRNRRIGFSEV
jgi:hypothetical protein